MFELMEAYLEWNKTRDLFELEAEWEREDFFSSGTIALIDRILIEKAFRSKGIGSKLLDESLAMMEKLNVHYFLLKAYPLEVKDFQENKHNQEFCANYLDQLKQLITFYKKNGFELMRDFNNDDLDQDVYMHKFVRGY